jgi:hypothetical protein
VIWEGRQVDGTWTTVGRSGGYMAIAKTFVSVKKRWNAEMVVER